ncbi:MAG: hypothetical protein ABR518_06590 [Actinomycetota bacterium]
MRKFAPFAVIILVLLATVNSSSGQLELEPTEVRVEKRIGTWSFGCTGFGTPRPDASSPVCFGTDMPTLTVQSPAGASNIDVVVTVSFEYSTTPGDWPDVAMRWKPEGGKFDPMKPGEVNLSPASAFDDTASATWFQRDLEGSGQSYVFELDVDIHKNSLNRTVTGRQTVVVIDMRPSE